MLMVHVLYNDFIYDICSDRGTFINPQFLFSYANSSTVSLFLIESNTARHGASTYMKSSTYFT